MIVVLDIETTGIDSKQHAVVEFYGILCTDDKRVRRKLHQRINPERSIPAASQAVHGITFDAVRDEPVWSEVAPKIHQFVSQANLIVGHNAANFDMPFLNARFEKASLNPITTPVFDTMEHSRWATPQGKKASLEELCFACDIDYDPAKAHAADYDVLVNAKAFFRAREWGFFVP